MILLTFFITLNTITIINNQKKHNTLNSLIKKFNILPNNINIHDKKTYISTPKKINLNKKNTTIPKFPTISRNKKIKQKQNKNNNKQQQTTPNSI